MAWALLVVAEVVHRNGGSISYKRRRNTLLRVSRLKLTGGPLSANTRIYTNSGTSLPPQAVAFLYQHRAHVGEPLSRSLGPQSEHVDSSN
jgi:hypothetical protein